MGFGVPLSKWLRNELKDTLTDVISESSLKDQQLFKPSQALQMRDAFLSGRRVEDERLQYLFLFQLWYNKWMK
jgi:asparagine synthase (glutamine-hydrolysing)